MKLSLVHDLGIERRKGALDREILDCISERGEGEIGERDLEEWRATYGRGERGERKCMCTIFSHFIQTQTHFINLYLYKSERGEVENESDN